MKDILFSDLPALVTDKSLLSPVSRKDCWHVVPYETAEVKGALLGANRDCSPAPLPLHVNLRGWYRIYVGCVALINRANTNTVNLKLDTDDAYTQFQPHRDIEGGGIEEVYWKCADMTDRTLILGKLRCTAGEENTLLGWLRFEEMTPQEIETFRTEQADTAHKHLYVTHDMHNIAYLYGTQTEEVWKLVTQPYEQSDVEWLSMENVFSTQPTLPIPQEEYGFNRLGDSNVQTIYGKPCPADFYPRLIAHAHKLGVKTAISHRMGQWDIPFPDEYIFTNSFWKEHPECRCVDRDGAELPIPSYAYGPIQDYVIGELVTRAKDGFDAVDLLFHRGIPYVLFEQPFCDRFAEAYGDAVDPRALPQTDVRLQNVRCAILTDFIAKLRAALNDAGLANVRIHLRCMHAVEDNKMLGLDPETLAQKKLVDAFIPHPVFARERLCGDKIWADTAHTTIDVAEYTKEALGNDSSIIWRREGFAYREDVKGLFENIGETPITEAQRLAAWVNLQNTCGVQVYFEIMPRVMSAEQYRKRILEIADAGGVGISLWDAYQRATLRNTWHLVGRATHFDWVRAQRPAPEGYCRRFRFQKLGGTFVGRYRPNWSM